jgi:type VI secretion system protein ImpE
MNADELYRAGRLQEAIDAQIQEVKTNPADRGRRLFLFELLAFAGDLERARRQIAAITYDQIELETAIQDYRLLLDAEEKRRRLFSEGVPPLFFADQPEHVRLRLEAIEQLRNDRTAEAAALLTLANDSMPPLHGTLDSKAFDSLRDCDDRFAGVLEVMARGNYFWVPLEQVVTLGMNAPRFPRDLLWAPAFLETKDAAGPVFVCALYPRSHEHADDRIKLGRTNDWQGPEEGPVFGVGARQFWVGEDAVNFLDWRKLEIAGNEAQTPADQTPSEPEA